MTETKTDLAQKKTVKSSSKKKKNIVNGVVHVFASFNNTIVSISDTSGNVVSWSSAGKHGFKGSRKATPYAAQVATQHVVNIAKEYGLQSVVVEIRGPGVGREASLRAIQACGVNVTLIKDITYLPHNGCRPAKSRRV
ncbi:MAG: 30S ribosomal protein S11 [Proteobacteria bacterium]|jgi:small subunit ribosomal protein S11|nr:30S ribosomal protein S11 [Pseudomonadota bacterium]